MPGSYKLRSGQINYENQANPGSYACVIIRNGEFLNLSEDMRLDLINRLQSIGKMQETVNLEDML